jgi:site-specific DNA-methyltransferase (adenine-specific)
MNTLYYGDNLDILRNYIPDESVDLIYLDPPFNSNRTYNVLFKDESGIQSSAQIAAFEDTWHWDLNTEAIYKELVTSPEIPSKVSLMISSLREFLETNQLMAYLTNMTIRLVELHRVLTPSGSLFLHCDPTASHYLKIILDTIFSNKSFRNEIIWHYLRWPAKQKNFQRMHDVILFYSKEYQNNTFNTLLEPLSTGTLKRWKGKKSKVEFDGEKRLVTQMTEEDSPGRPMDDVWDIPVINSQAKERLGYPTQKPLALLNRIIEAASEPGDVVLDPFCGCGTAIASAQSLGRQWIGIDITHLAIALIKYRLEDSFPGIQFEIQGEPESVNSARYLAESDRHQFEWWALSLIRARPGQPDGDHGKKGADRGIDGIINFIDDASGKPQKAIIQVKSGHVSSAQIRDLVGTMNRTNAPIGIFITLEEPTKPMLKEAAEVGFYHSKLWDKDYPKLQIFTIEELLKGKEPQLPPSNVTFQRAQKQKGKSSTNQPSLLGGKTEGKE